MAVTNQFQQVSGICISGISGERRSITVAMTLIAVSSEPTANAPILKNQSVWPSPSPGPAIAPTALSGG